MNWLKSAQWLDGPVEAPKRENPLNWVLEMTGGGIPRSSIGDPSPHRPVWNAKNRSRLMERSTPYEPTRDHLGHPPHNAAPDPAHPVIQMFRMKPEIFLYEPAARGDQTSRCSSTTNRATWVGSHSSIAHSRSTRLANRACSTAPAEIGKCGTVELTAAPCPRT